MESVISTRVVPNPLWDEVEDNSFKPYNDAKWENICKGETRKDADFTINGVFFYIPTESTEDDVSTGYEMLTVEWPNKTGRASFGYVIRKTETKEVVALIHQDFGWSWAFKLKNEPERFLEFRHTEDGWVYENLLKNTLNSVMSWLLL